MQYRYKLALQRQRDLEINMFKKSRFSSPFSSKPPLYQSQSPKVRKQSDPAFFEVQDQINRLCEEELQRLSLEKMLKTIKQLDRVIELTDSQSEQQSKQIERLERLIGQFGRLVQAMEQECVFLQKQNRTLSQKLE